MARHCGDENGGGVGDEDDGGSHDGTIIGLFTFAGSAESEANMEKEAWLLRCRKKALQSLVTSLTRQNEALVVQRNQAENENQKL